MRSSLPPTVVSVFELDPRKFGSMEEYTVFLSQSLRNRGWRSVLVFSRLPPPEILSHFEGTGAILEVCPVDSKARFYPALWRTLWKYQAEIVHFHFFEHFSLLPLLPWLAKARLTVFTDHFRQPQSLSLLTRLNLLLWNQTLARFLDVRLVAISQHIKNTLVDGYQVDPRRIRVILNGVNGGRFESVGEDEIRSQQRELGIPPGAPVLATVAAFIPQKGLDDLLLAARQVLAQKPASVFLIVGDGPLGPRLRQQAQDLGILSSIRFTGLRSDVHRLLALADVVAVPSVWQEPAGLIVIEAMAAGKPVVATRVGGIPEYMLHEVNGVLVEPRNPEALARAMLFLLESPQVSQAMGLAGRQRASQHFAMGRWVNETLDLYDQALPGVPARRPMKAQNS